MKYFTKGELCLWGGSVLTVLTAFFLFHGGNYLNLTASLIGVTSLIFAAKGSPAAQFMMIIFSILYGVISWHSAYYGEMITYLGMTMPMAVVSLISWLRHPYQGDKSQVEINHIKKQEIPFLAGSDNHCHNDILFHPEIFSYSKFIIQYNFRHNELCCSVSHIPEKSLLCACLCRE